MAVSPDLVPVAAGIALLVLAVIWRTLSRRSHQAAVRARLEAALADPDPGTRRAAVVVATEHGLSPVGQPLLNAILRETDPTVLDAIATAVARNQWEPLDSTTLLELRLWAQRRLEQRTRPAQPGDTSSPPQVTVLPTRRTADRRQDAGA